MWCMVYCVWYMVYCVCWYVFLIFIGIHTSMLTPNYTIPLVHITGQEVQVPSNPLSHPAFPCAVCGGQWSCGAPQVHAAGARHPHQDGCGL